MFSTRAIFAVAAVIFGGTVFVRSFVINILTIMVILYILSSTASYSLPILSERWYLTA